MKQIKFLFKVIWAKTQLKFLSMKLLAYVKAHHLATKLSYQMWILSTRHPNIGKSRIFRMIFQRVTTMKYAHDIWLKEYQEKVLFILAMINMEAEKLKGKDENTRN